MNPRARRVRFCTLRAAQLRTEKQRSTAVNGAARYSSQKDLLDGSSLARQLKVKHRRIFRRNRWSHFEDDNLFVGSATEASMEIGVRGEATE
ncbi:uncharacterized protein ACO6RY_11604 [Pungitius sinensis]